MTLENRVDYIEQCTRCSQCKFTHMPKSKDFSSACPSKYHSKFHASSAGGQLITAYGYQKGVIEVSPNMVDSVYACSMCGACDTMCKTHQGDNVEPFDTLLAFREQLAKDGHVPDKLVGLVKNLEQEGAPKGKRSERSLWAKGLGIKDATKEPVDVLLHVGSEYAYDEAQWQSLKFIVKLLEKAKVDFGFAYDAESDSGGMAYEIGYQDIAEKLAQDWSNIVDKSRATIVLALNAEGYASFKNLYPRMNKALSSVRVLHTTEFVEDLLNSGKLSLALSGQGKAVYHDACRLGRRSEEYQAWDGDFIRVLNTLRVTDSPRKVNFGNEGNYDAPRNLLSKVEGLELLEMERNRQYSFCCGGCPSVKEGYPKMAKGAAEELLSEAESAGAEVLISGSSCCQANMAEAAKKCGSPIKVTTVFDLLADSVKENV